MGARQTPTDRALHLALIVLTLATALIHMALNFPDIVFILNGLGYVALLAVLTLPLPRLESYRPMARWAMIGYTALAIVIWLIIGERSPIGYSTKAIEVALIIVLLIIIRRAR